MANNNKTGYFNNKPNIKIIISSYRIKNLDISLVQIIFTVQACAIIYPYN